MSLQSTPDTSTRYSTRPGSADYLIERGISCPHDVSRIVPGPDSGIPHRLEFLFSNTDKIIARLDTNQLCPICFDELVPKGFWTWSLSYDNSTNKFGSFPAQVAAGTCIEKAEIVADSVAFPSPEASSVFARMRHSERPFYIDLLHQVTAWDDRLKGEERLQQQRRIAAENGPAYMTAARILVPDGEGGYGWNTTAEQRIGQRPYNRLSAVNPRYDEGETGRTTLKSADRFTYILTIPRSHYVFPWPHDHNTNDSEPGSQEWNIEAVSLEDAIANQIKEHPRSLFSYLSQADRVIYDYYTENPGSTRWPEEPDQGFRYMKEEDIDVVDEMMTGTRNSSGDWETEKLAREESRRQLWAKRDSFRSPESRASRIKDLLERRNVPEDLWPAFVREIPHYVDSDSSNENH